MKNIGKLAVLGAVLAASASGFAATLTGSVWEIPAFTNVPLGSTLLAYTTLEGAPTATFSLTNASPTNLFNFNSNNCGNCYTLAGFLGSGGDGVTLSSNGTDLLDFGVTPTTNCSSNCVKDDLFQFTGSTTLAAGKYNFQHDDGLLLYLGGTLVVNEGGPTSAVNTTLCVGTGLTGCDYTISVPSGPESFTLDFAEVDGAPAVLTTNLPLTSDAPEPNSLILLGTGLMGGAGMLFRRRRVTA